MMNKGWAACLAAVVTTGIGLASSPVRAEDCTGLLPLNDCTLDEDTTAPLEVNVGVTLTIGADVQINHAIDGDTGATKGNIATDGGGRTILQQADIGAVNSINAMLIDTGDVWYVSGGTNLFMEPLAPVRLSGGLFGVAPNSALSFISAGIQGDAGNDALDFVSGGQSLGTTGFLGRAGERIDLGSGNDRFLYYQSGGSVLGADSIRLGNGDDFMGLLGTSVGSVFTGDFNAGQNDDTLVFYSGSAVTFGALTSSMTLGLGDDVLDLSSGGALASGILLADTLDLSGDNDMLLLAGDAALYVSAALLGGTGDDLVLLSAGGLIDAQGATVDLGDGDDTLRFQSVAFDGAHGLNVAYGTLALGAGNDRLIFTDDVMGLNATGTTVDLGDGDDRIVFESFSGSLAFASGTGFLAVDGGAGTDTILFGSAPDVTFGTIADPGSIANVETLHFGSGTLHYRGTIDSAANIVAFTSAEFLGSTTDIAATVTGSGGSESILFASGALFSGTAALGGGPDSAVFQSGGSLTGALDLGAGDDTLTFGSGAVFSGTADGGAGTDTVLFASGAVTVSGSAVNFTSGLLAAGSTVTLRSGGALAMKLSGTGTVRFGSAGATENFTLGGTVDGVAVEIAGATLDTNGFTMGATSPLRGLTVESGALLLANDAIDLGDGVADANGTLINRGTIRFSPTATVSADRYDTADSGTFIFEINRTGGVTQVGGLALEEAGQSLDFSSSGSNDTFRFVMESGSEALGADTISFLSAGAGGTVTGPEAANVFGSTILFNLALLDADADPQDLELVVTRTNTIQGLANSQSNAALGAVLIDDLINATDPGIVALQNALLNTHTAGGFNRVLETARPILNGGELAAARAVNRQTFGLINRRLSYLRDDSRGATGISTGNVSKEVEAWWQFYGQAADQSARNTVSGFDSTTYGLAVGADHAMTDNLVAGASFAWGQSTVQSRGAGDARTEVDSYQGSLYADYDFGRAYVNGIASYAYNDIGTLKTSAAGDRSGTYHAGYFGARAEAGYAFLPGKTRLIPKLTAQYGYYSPDSYLETGPGAQKITGDSVTVAELGTGLDMDWLLKNGEGSYFVPQVNLGYRYDFAGAPVRTTAQFLAGGPAFTMEGYESSPHTLDLGIGLTYFSRDDWELLLRYDLEMRQDYFAQSGTVRASYKFYR